VKLILIKDVLHDSCIYDRRTSTINVTITRSCIEKVLGHYTLLVFSPD